MIDLMGWRIASFVVWSVVVVTMAPGAYRVLRHRSRTLDLIWTAFLLLALNRIAFLLDTVVASGGMRSWCYATAIAAAIYSLFIAWGYQRHDR